MSRTMTSQALPRLSDRGLRSIAELVRGYCGISVGADKHQLVENRLRRRVRELKFDSLEAYADYVAADPTGAEIETLVDLLSTNHTAFFREVEHVHVLFDRLGPALRRREVAGASLRVWSAGASSGEEPFTLAMMAAEDTRLNPLSRWSFTASDISHRMLAVAKRGVYSLSAVDAVPLDLLHYYFERGVGAQDGNCRLRRELRDTVVFRRINLLDEQYPFAERQHVIFCRNVLIYFDLPTRKLVVERLMNYLAPGGFLVVGYSESLSGLVSGLRSFSHGVYTRV